MATGGFLLLVLLFGGISSAVSRHAEPISGKVPSNVSPGTGQADFDATVEVTRVVDGDTIDISPSIEGRSRVRQDPSDPNYLDGDGVAREDLP